MCGANVDARTLSEKYDTRTLKWEHIMVEASGANCDIQGVDTLRYGIKGKMSESFF